MIYIIYEKGSLFEKYIYAKILLFESVLLTRFNIRRSNITNYCWSVLYRI